MKKNILILFLSLNALNLYSQLKVGSNPKSISNNINLEVESSTGRNFVITRDSSKVGVGTVSPSHLMHIIDSVNDPVRIVGLNSGKSSDSLLTVDSLGIVKRLSSLSISSYTEPWFNAATNTSATSNTQNIYQMGKVGINVTNPTWMLDVRTNSANSELVAHFVNSSQASTAESQVAIGAGPGVWTKIVGYDGTLGIRNYSTNKEFVSFKPHTGFVGIGTNSPISRLHVVKDSLETDGYDDYLFDSYGTTVQGMELRKFNGKVGSPTNITNGTLIGYYGFSPRANNNNLYGTTGMFGYYTGDGINANSELRFRTSYLDRMTINSSGFVGVGTITPWYPMHIKTALNTNLFLENTSGDPDGALAISIPNYNINCGGSVTCSNMVSFMSGGVWIGTITPTSNGQGTQYITTSDFRLKENIKNTSFSINDLMKIKVVEYNYKLDKSKSKEIGFIAQDLNEIIPTVVTKGDEEVGENGLPKKPWMVDYSRLTPMIIKATQELKNEIDKIDNLNQALKEKLNQKDIEISKLKDMIFELSQEFQTFKSAKK